MEAKSQNPQQVEVIVSVDKGDENCVNVLKDLQGFSKVRIKYLEGVRSRGYFEANLHYNECLHLSDPQSQFFAIFSDKLKMDTQGWDKKLKNYSNYFEDGLFRVRISCFKDRRYNGDLHDALSKPDNFAFHSRKFVELCGGWGDTWGPDTWAQGVVFFCELLNINDRDIVASDIALQKYFYSDSSGITKSSQMRGDMIVWSFNFLCESKIALYNFYRIAAKMKLYIDNYALISKAQARGYDFLYESNRVILCDDSGNVIADKKLSDFDSSDANLYLLQSPIRSLITKSSQTFHGRIVRFRKMKMSAKKLLLLLNLLITRVKFAGKILIELVILSLSLVRICKCYQSSSIVCVSESGQFNVEQNSDIERAIAKKHSSVYL